MENFCELSYNHIMKKIALVLGIILFLTPVTNAEEQIITSPAPEISNMADEVNSSFSESKKTNWFIHRIKPHGKHKFEGVNKGVNKEVTDKVNDKEIKTEFVKENNTKKVTTSEEKKIKEVPQKETVHTTEPAEKVLKDEAKALEKEEKKKLKEEEKNRQYKELQELTDLYQQAVALYTDNNLDASLEAFAKMPEDKRPAQAWLLMGNILMDKGKKDEAVFMYGRAVLTEPNFYKGYYNLGNVYLADDKFNMAIEQYKLAVKYNPNNAYVFYNLGCAYLKIGELRKAKNAFIRAIELNNQVADFHFNMAYVYKKLKKDKQAKIFLNNYNKLTGQVD